MWLPLCVFFHVSISQLILQANASYRHPRLLQEDSSWCPLPDTGASSFLFRYHWPPIEEDSLHGVSRPTQAEIDCDEEARSYFKKQYENRRAGPKHKELLRNSFHYLRTTHITSAELLKKWCHELVTAISTEVIENLRYDAIVPYGLNTLLLRYHDNEPLTEIILSYWIPIKEFINQKPKEPIGDDRTEVWTQELFWPDSGLSETLRNREILQDMLKSEDKLAQLRLAIADPENRRSQIGSIKQIFSKKPAEDITSYGRVVSIAALYHAMRSGDEVLASTATQIAREFQTGDEFFILDHEQRLLNKLLEDHDNPKEEPVLTTNEFKYASDS